MADDIDLVDGPASHAVRTAEVTDQVNRNTESHTTASGLTTCAHDVTHQAETLDGPTSLFDRLPGRQ